MLLSLFSKYFVWSLYLICHIMSYCVVLSVMYNFILLGLYLNTKHWEKKLLKRAQITKSNNQNSFFETTPFYRTRICHPQKFFNFLSSLFVITAAFRADSASLWIIPKKSEIMKNQYFDGEQQPATVSVATSPTQSLPPLVAGNKYDKHLLKNNEPAIRRCITHGINRHFSHQFRDYLYSAHNEWTSQHCSINYLSKLW